MVHHWQLALREALDLHSHIHNDTTVCTSGSSHSEDGFVSTVNNIAKTNSAAYLVGVPRSYGGGRLLSLSFCVRNTILQTRARWVYQVHAKLVAQLFPSISERIVFAIKRSLAFLLFSSIL